MKQVNVTKITPNMENMSSLPIEHYNGKKPRHTLLELIATIAILGVLQGIFASSSQVRMATRLSCVISCNRRLVFQLSGLVENCVTRHMVCT